MMMRIGGKNVVVLPDMVKITRTWKERLFTLPWRPLQKTKWVANNKLPNEGDVYMSDNVIYCSERTYNKLQELMKEKYLS